jgi:hypothetical protein
MYLSILGGALFGLPSVLLVCTLIATGASLCYAISAALGPPLLAVSPKWQRRVDLWTDKVQAQGSNLGSYLIVLRIAPLPPHWVVNVRCHALVSPCISANASRTDHLAPSRHPVRAVLGDDVDRCARHAASTSVRVELITQASSDRPISTRLSARHSTR